MSDLKKFIGGLAALALLAALAYAAWLALQQLVALYGGLQPQVAAVTALALAALLLSALWMASAVRRVGRDRLEVPRREEKAATYRLFVECWQQRLASRATTDELDDAMASLGRLLALCGSAALVDKHVRLLAQDGDAWYLFTEAVQQIRRELDAEPLTGAALQALLATQAVVPGASSAAPAAEPALAAAS